MLIGRKVDILTIAAEEFVPLLFKDSYALLSSLTENAIKENEELPTEDMFALYRKIREIWDLYRQIVQKYVPSPLDID